MINIEQLYYTVSAEDAKLNPFETSESNRLYTALYNKYIEPHDNDQMKGFDLIGDLITTERRTAFEVGFKTAIQLFLEGMSPMAKERR